MQTRLLINDELVAGDGPAVPTHDPATGQQIASIPEASPEQVEAATRTAAEAFETFGRSTPGERAALLLAIADTVEAHAEELAALETLDVGKPWPSALGDEMPLTIDTFRFFAGAARTMQGSAAGEYVAGHTSMIRRDPIGPVAAIAPWNYPLMMAAWKLAAPLAAGCPVVLKPSEVTPLATLRLAELLRPILPRGVLNVLHGRGPSVGQHMLDAPQIEAISITGSPATGQAAMQAAARQLRHVHLELGGKAPVIVCADADVAALVATIRAGAFFNAGQDCAQPCRILVQDRIYDRVAADLALAVGSIRIGAPRDADVEMGPIVSAAQRERVAGFVDRARAECQVLTGGAAPEGAGYFYRPTVVADVDDTAEIARHEVFGPVVTLSRFTDEDQVIRTVNAGRYGLASSVWTRDAPWRCPPRCAMALPGSIRMGSPRRKCPGPR